VKKILFLSTSVVLILAGLSLAGCSNGGPLTREAWGINLGSQQEGIWVSGQGKVTVKPDIVTMRLGIESQQNTVAEAQKKAAEAMDRVMTTLTGNGVADKDIQTQSFNIQKVTRWDNDKQLEIVLGYRVGNIVAAKLRDLKKAGAIIDAVAVAGGDLTRIDSIAFSIDDPSRYQEQARQKAMADANATAKQLANLGGVTLGKPTYISESGYVPSPIYSGGMMKAQAAESVPTPISPGEMEVSLNVQVVYAILK